LLFAALFGGCTGRQDLQSERQNRHVIQNTGSDTMVNLAQAWAEEYAQVEPGVSVEVSGGGSGTGIAALINGTADLVNSSRKIEPEELAKASASSHGAPTEYILGFDALAVYVHRASPLEVASLPQLADIYGEHGRTVRWTQLIGGASPCASDEIIRVSRQSNSGTFQYFREALVGKEGDLKLGSIDLHGSKDVVELIGRTPCAIGYSGMGYVTGQVKMLQIARKQGEPAFAPTVDNTLSRKYPIARPLFVYARGGVSDETKRYVAWLQSEAGQAIVAQTGYVPVASSLRKP
jgi:phosphate transport system substrate-binding protein